MERLPQADELSHFLCVHLSVQCRARNQRLCPHERCTYPGSSGLPVSSRGFLCMLLQQQCPQAQARSLPTQVGGTSQWAEQAGWLEGQMVNKEVNHLLPGGNKQRRGVQ